MLAVLLGVFLVSPDGTILAAMRASFTTILLIRGVLMSSAFVTSLRIRTGRLSARENLVLGWRGFTLVALNATGTVMFVSSLRNTTIAHTLFISATVPAMTAGLSWLSRSEVVPRRTVLAASGVLVGVAVLVASSPDTSALAGDLEALGGAFALAAGLLVAPRDGRLAVAQALSATADMIDVDACEAAGIEIIRHTDELHAKSRLINAKGTADLTVALLMCLAYRVVESDAYTRAGRFRQEMTMELMGVGCTGKVAGIIGMGSVARQLVPRLKALDMPVIYTKRTRLPAEEEAQLGIRWVHAMDDLLPQSDFVCMMANYNPSSHMLMGADQFALMRSDSYFINTGRGRLVDEAAMIKALQDGTIAGAGLDVYWNEPPVVHDPDVPLALRQLPNVVLAPHNGGATWDSRGLQAEHMAQSIVDAINGAYVSRVP